MSVESDAASQVASIYTTGIRESANVAIKIMGEVFQISKELATLLFTKGIYNGLIKQEGKEAGLLKLNNLLRKSSSKGYPLQVLEIKDKGDFKILSKELEKNGVMFAKANGKDNFNIIFTEDYAAIVNKVIERNNLTSVQKISDSEVKSVEKDNAKTIEVDDSNVFIENDNLQNPPSEDTYLDNLERKSKVTPEEDKSSISIEDDNLQSPESEESYTDKIENNTTIKDSGDEYIDELDFTDEPDPYTDGDYYNEYLPFDDDQIEGEFDYDELIATFDPPEKEEGYEVPLAMDGERAAPSKQEIPKDENKDKIETVSDKLEHKKQERDSVVVKESFENVKDTSSAVKESAKDVKDTIGGK